MTGKQWPKLGDIILVQDRPTTEAQRELWAKRQPPTRKGEVVEIPKPDGSGFLVIDVGGEYGGVNYAARDFGVRYTWKPANKPKDASPALASLIEQARALPPEQKIELFEALGMRRVGDNHDPDCTGRNTSAPHNCVPPASTWGHPKDVEAYLREAWEDRLAAVTEQDQHRRGRV